VLQLRVNRVPQVAQLRLGHIPLCVIDRLELTAVNGYQVGAKQLPFFTEEGQGAKHVLEGGSLVLAKVRNRFEVGVECAEEPEACHVPGRFLLQAPAGADPVHVTVDVQLEQVARVIGGAPSRGGLHASKAEGVAVQTVDKGLNETHRVLRSDVVVEDVRK
jgi:hypothetical protein